MAIPYPSLSSKAWIEDPLEVIDSVMANFLVTQPSLSELSSKFIISLPAIIQQFGNSETDIVTNMQSNLETLLSRYFPGTDQPNTTPTVEAHIDYPNPDDETRMRIRIQMAVLANGEWLNVGKVLQDIDGKYRLIQEINNNG